MDTIPDLLPNEHILNFHVGVPSLPDWLGDNLKVILGAGDLDQNLLNVQMFSMFDVFFCEPWDNEGSLRKNIEYLLTHFHHKKVICFINIRNPSQVEQFCRVFRNRFILVDGYGGHTPHLSLDCIAEVLKPGGTAVNIYESYENVYPEEALIQICNKPTSSLKKSDAGMFFAKFKLYEVENPVNRNIIESTYAECLQRHAWKLASSRPIQVDWSIFTNMDSFTKLHVAKILIAVLLEYDSLPRGLQGIFRMNTRIWNIDRTLYELVVIKVAEGGRKKYRSRSRSHSRSSSRSRSRSKRNTRKQ